MQALIPDWIRAHPEPVLRLPVDVTRYMSSTGRGDDVWWPQRLSTWYEGWQRRRSPEVLVTVHFGGDPRGTQQYYEWFVPVALPGRSDRHHAAPEATGIPLEETIRLSFFGLHLPSCIRNSVSDIFISMY
ncbi:hypothetical protein PIB30_072627 [Stylosanthes scabra]|uniref:Uncharacterized protein n=1 Tax=Stylosanthes scabra TaxID=79078 RepID=A0ABU6QNP6_9FABA|nr:hypothetical protein [Stylosanthes scabra]